MKILAVLTCGAQYQDGWQCPRPRLSSPGTFTHVAKACAHKRSLQMSFISEFRQFAVRGNVADMAVGIIIGGAFGKIVSSLVNDIIMPPLGVVVGGVDFQHLKLTLKPAADGVAAVTLNYGQFIQVTVDFLIVAFAIFLVVRAMNSLQRKEEQAPAPAPIPAPSQEEKLLAEIRDILRSK